MIFLGNTLIKQSIKIMIKKPIHKTTKPSCTSLNPGYPDSDNDIPSHNSIKQSMKISIRKPINKTTNPSCKSLNPGYPDSDKKNRLATLVGVKRRKSRAQKRKSAKG
jgi:hypothetical protein